jgi:hypothetical protein
MFGSQKATRFPLRSWWKSWRRAKPTVRRTNAGRQCLLLEALEDRCLMSYTYVLNENDSGPDSLREAIQDVNNDGDSHDVIDFAMPLGPHVIYLRSPLPAITKPVDIEGDSQGGYDGFPMICIDGSLAGPQTTGLDIRGGDSGISGLNIRNFSRFGVMLSEHGDDYIVHCTIGTDRPGRVAMPNREGGVVILSDNNSVGAGPNGALLPNVISGNGGAGVWINGSSATDNTVKANKIGVNDMGVAFIPNSDGVVIDSGAHDNTIENGNLISGNNSSGITVRSGPNSIFSNYICGNGGAGVLLTSGASANKVGFNDIGTNGYVAIPNGQDGVRLDAFAHDNVIDFNVISGNSGSGVALVGAYTTGNVVSNNRIGTDGGGTSAIGNTHGVYVALGAHDNTIGGSWPPNIISGNRGSGVCLSLDSNHNSVLGNYIGLTSRGDQALGNGTDGVLMNEGAYDNTVASNVISGNDGSGVGLGSYENGVVANWLVGNWIGLSATTLAAVGNHEAGVTTTTAGNFITYNVVSGNNGPGILLTGARAVNNLVYHNLVGTEYNGIDSMPNGGAGVAITNTASSNQISSNTIAFNAGTGVQVGATPNDLCTGNAILANGIFANGALGIDLGNDGVTPNQNPDHQPGPNMWQNCPIVNSATSDGTNTTLAGALQSTPNTTFTLQFFVNNALDPSGFGQGERLLYSGQVTTGADGAASLQLLVSGGTPGQFVTATATDPAGNTSEFSQGLQISAAPGGGGAPSSPLLRVPQPRDPGLPLSFVPPLSTGMPTVLSAPSNFPVGQGPILPSFAPPAGEAQDPAASLARWTQAVELVFSRHDSTTIASGLSGSLLPPAILLLADAYG